MRPDAAQRRKNVMKNKFLLAAATLAILTVANPMMAAEPLLSPRAKALADSVRTVSGSTSDLIDRSVLPGTPRGRELVYSLRKVPSTDSRVDLAHGARPLFSPKDPRYETALRELRATAFQVAPLK
jgi:hypothetical protein